MYAVQLVIDNMVRAAVEHPNCSQLAFDARGRLIDWCDIGSRRWTRGSEDPDRVYVIAGGASRDIIEATVTRRERH